ncbi:MAG: UDP-N-acetylglucosamine 2-epimerase (non-hydrolyzing) [Bacteroidales bacterium]|nr:UDP-N-acetylglucosamine 2-epimerase (non-hydrolyzing) [Bacteroidales bacterium]
MIKALIVIGTRPEAIKMAPVVKELQRYAEEFNCVVCSTGQHRRILNQVLSMFGIVPDHDLDIMRPGQDLYDISSGVLLGLRQVLAEERPDYVLVHGDTTTSVAAAMAAYFARVPVIHVEAGLRTYDPLSPWPEEINRQIISRIATHHFAPTQTACENLIKENVDASIVTVTGNTGIDALRWICDSVGGNTVRQAYFADMIRNAGYDLDRISAGRRLILVTGHRRENFGSGLRSVCRALKRIASHYSDVDILYPMHPNPNVRQAIADEFGDNSVLDGLSVFFIEPLEYPAFILAMYRASIVITDSGGIQEEAPALGKPVLVTRETTERTEAVSAGTVRLVGTDCDRIVSAARRLLDDSEEYASMASAVNPYGDGEAASRIVETLRKISQ